MGPGEIECWLHDVLSAVFFSPHLLIVFYFLVRRRVHAHVQI
jgi:hypothetical protein